MTSPTFRGIVPPVLTPLTTEGEVDVASLERLVDHLVTEGVHGLFVLGSTGEVAYLTDEQRDLVVRTVVRAADGRVPVMGGAIDLTTARVVERAKALVAAGADAVVATAPVYALNDLDEIERHLRAVAAAVDVPLFAYDIPVRVRTKLPADLLVRLGVEGVLAGVKDSSGDDVGFRRLVAANAAAGSPLALFTGHEVVVDGMLLLGADGVVPGLANVDAGGYVRLWDLAQAGKWDDAKLEQDRIAALFEIVFQAKGRSGDAAGVGAFKIAARAQGLIDTPTLAFPVEALDADVAARVEEITRAAGLLGD
ncbi:dihydrodipicolinate synthase family protein [Cellulosimicrobium composti]|uniref:Dihydrodipicolinate synthase family protein n=1 Tax=Cellulosimicrobium composti TaxID=2672572 RepID=A0A6N7ZHC3_9MICO|nr:dihydrodipicolinate synthase family protein [Cellulosimicrobium composti]MTG88816.1 dihydrodipicolinate synthase family protein [Cellulosimicrobium composti]NDO91138.1 dihydrodipicolinate synthase family protein [Cellulosimicrobium composti]